MAKPGSFASCFPISQSEHDNPVEISWDEFFKAFDENNLALLYDENSQFNKIVGRDTVERREYCEHDATRKIEPNRA
jgi:hypothetical protein